MLTENKSKEGIPAKLLSLPDKTPHAKIKNTIFRRCQLQEADFADCDLTGAVFDHCDLEKAIFENTILEKADFLTAFNYSINPDINKIKKAKFSIFGIAGLLDKYDIVNEN